LVDAWGAGELDEHAQEDAVDRLLVDVTGVVLYEGTYRQSDSIVANAKGHWLCSRVDAAARAELETAAEIEDARVRVNVEASAKPGKPNKGSLLNLVRANVAIAFADIRTRKAALVDDQRIAR
jgi:hypothetical protein